MSTRISLRSLVPFSFPLQNIEIDDKNLYVKEHKIESVVSFAHIKNVEIRPIYTVIPYTFPQIRITVDDVSITSASDAKFELRNLKGREIDNFVATIKKYSPDAIVVYREPQYGVLLNGFRFTTLSSKKMRRLYWVVGGAVIFLVVGFFLAATIPLFQLSTENIPQGSLRAV